MHTRLLEGVPPLENDAKVVAMLNFAASRVRAGPTIYRVGVRNKDGCVYRIVEAHDLEEARRLVTALANFGFTEEDSPQTEEFSSTFGKLSA